MCVWRGLFLPTVALAWFETCLCGAELRSVDGAKSASRDKRVLARGLFVC